MTLSWLARVDDLRVRAGAARRDHARQLLERKAFEAFKAAAGFRRTPDGKAYEADVGSYEDGLRAYVASLPAGSAKLPEERVRGFKVVLSLDEVDPGSWEWTCSMSGSGSAEDRDAILARLGCPAERRKPTMEMPYSTQWDWPAAVGDVPS